MRAIGLIALILGSTNLFAEINNPGEAARRLQYDCQRLDQMVRYSNLHSQVKYSVSTLARDAERLEYCLRYTRSDRRLERPGDRPYERPFEHRCDYELNAVRHSNNVVNRDLYNAQFQYPDIYNQYTRVQYSLRDVEYALSNNNPNPQMVRCVAVDAGWEEHSGGHAAYGRTVQEAQYAADRECRRFHGQCRINRCEY